MFGRQAHAQHRAVGIEAFVQPGGIGSDQCGMHGAEIGERAGDVEFGQRDQRSAPDAAQAFRRCAAVGADQAAGAELDAAVPARDHQHHRIETLAVERLQHGLACGAGGFAVIGKTVILAQAVGPAIVRGLRIGDLLQEGQRRGRRGHRRSLAEETAFLDFLQRRRGLREGA